MPIYTYKCRECQSTTEQVRPYSMCDVDMPECCGQTTFIQIQPPMMVTIEGMDSYVCPVTDQVVTSQRQRKRIEDENEITLIEPGMFKRKPKEATPELPEPLKAELTKTLAEANQG